MSTKYAQPSRREKYIEIPFEAGFSSKEIIKTFENQGFLSRYILFVSFCSTLSLVSLFFSSKISYSMIILDSIGICIAAFCAGIGTAILVALIVAILGSVLIVGSEFYILYSISNFVCAFIWSYIPRSSLTVIGADLFEISKSRNYRRAILNFILFSSFCAFASTTIIIAIQKGIFDYQINYEMAKGSSFNLNFIKNIFKITAFLFEDVKFRNDISEYLLFFFPHLISQFVDKLIVVLISFVVIYSLFDPPHFRNQIERVSFSSSDNGEFSNGKVFIITCIILWIISVFYVVSNSIFIMNAAGWFFMTAILLILLSKKDILISIDPHRIHKNKKPLFLPRSTLAIQYPNIKDIVEDVLKMTSLFFASVQIFMYFAKERFVGLNPVNLVIDQQAAQFSNEDFFIIVITNILLINGIRYLIVSAMRYFDRI